MEAPSPPPPTPPKPHLQIFGKPYVSQKNFAGWSFGSGPEAVARKLVPERESARRRPEPEKEGNKVNT